MDDFDEFDDWMDEINRYPLTTNRIYNYADAIRTNQQIVNNIYSIRRHLEFNESDDSNGNNNFVSDVFTSAFQMPLRNIDQTVIDSTDSSVIENLFMMLLNNSNGGVSNVFNELFNFTPDDLEDVKVTLTTEQFAMFPETTFSDKCLDVQNTQCSICMEDYVTDDTLTTLHCKHVFHKSCIQNWLCKERVTCPVCRKDMRETDH